MAQVTAKRTKKRSRLIHALTGVFLALSLVGSCLFSWNQLTKFEYGFEVKKVTHVHGVTYTVFYPCKGFGPYLKCPNIRK